MIICLIFIVLIFILWLFLSIHELVTFGFNEDIVGYTIFALLIQFFLILPFLAIDRSSGVTIGKITSVDKNFFGTTAIYIKVNETKEEEYCAEDEEVIEIAKEYIGKNVKISYGTRVGLYHLNQCRQAPIEKIEIVE